MLDSLQWIVVPGGPGLSNIYLKGYVKVESSASSMIGELFNFKRLNLSFG